MKAQDVFNAALETYRKYGNEDYAMSKANTFVRHCLNGKSQDCDIQRETIASVVYAMLDSDSEDVFWWNLDAVAAT